MSIFLLIYLWDIQGEKNKRVFRGYEKDPYEVWFLARFHTSFSALLLKFLFFLFFNYSLGNILLSWKHFLYKTYCLFLVGLCFLFVSCILSFFLNESCLFHKKNYPRKEMVVSYLYIFKSFFSSHCPMDVRRYSMNSSLARKVGSSSSLVSFLVFCLV